MYIGCFTIPVRRRMQVVGKDTQVLLGGGSWTRYILENERNFLFDPFKERIS